MKLLNCLVAFFFKPDFEPAFSLIAVASFLSLTALEQYLEITDTRGLTVNECLSLWEAGGAEDGDPHICEQFQVTELYNNVSEHSFHLLKLIYIARARKPQSHTHICCLSY